MASEPPVDVNEQRRERPARPTVITAYPNGPLLVRGDISLVDSDGTPIPCRRRTIALCRCGHSAISPLCDGTHKVTGFKAAGSALREQRRGLDGD